MKRKILLSFLVLVFVSLSSLQAQWTQMSMPGSHGGAIYSICFKDGKMFAGIKGGVYVSADDGEHWLKVNPNVPPREYASYVSSIVANEQSVFAAFNEPGVYSTSDDGQSWNMADIPEGLRVTPQKLAANGNWIIGSNIVGNSYQSLDNGLTWNRIMDFTSYNSAYSIAIQDSFALAVATNGIFLSSDYGSNWVNVNESSTNYYGSALAFSGSNALAGINGHILQSTDKGLTWSPNNAILNCTSINSLTFSPDEATGNYVFAGTDSGVFRSTDYGVSWQKVNNGLNSNLIFCLAFKKSKTEGTPVLFAGTGNGIFHSTDLGTTWSVTGSPSEWCFASAESDLFAASSNSVYGIPEEIYQTVIYHSSDNGINWEKKFSGYLHNNSKISSIDVVDNNGNFNLYAIIEGLNNDINPSLYSTIILSDDLGTSWRKIYPDSTNNFSVMKTYLSTIFVCEFLRYDYPGHSYSAGSIFRSSDFGNSWWRVVDSADVNAFAFDGNKIYAGGGYQFAAPNPNPPPRMLVYHRNLLINSTDSGTNWITVESPLDSAGISSLYTDTISEITALCVKNSHLFAGMQAYYFSLSPYVSPMVYGGGLVHLIQNGPDWIVVDTSFVGKSVFDLIDNMSNIYAATDSGIFRSLNYGTTWDDVSLGMNNIYVSTLFKSDNYLFARTINGVWKRPLSEITSVEDKPLTGVIPENYKLEQNYPNPFNPTTKIKYSIPENGYISLKVYDMLGEEVAILFEGYQKAGSFVIPFDASKLASGIYMYQLKTNNFVKTKKLILLK